MSRSLIEFGIELQRPHRPGEHRAPCPWCDKGPRDDALAIKVEPDGGATWFCHRCEERGGLGNGHRSETATLPNPNKSRGAARNGTDRHEALSDWGSTLWEAAHPIEPGTIAATYLARRGCMLPPIEGHLRWHRELSYHVRDQRGPIHVGPALVALVTDTETGEPISLHRTWITATGKADLGAYTPRKLLWNHRSDGVVRLWPDDKVILGLVLGEGVETCLAGARAGLTPCWATISAANLAAFPVLPGIEGLTILVDHDKPNPKTGRRAGHEAARELVAHYVATGLDAERDIVIVLPSGEGLDVADLGAAA